MLVKMKKPVQGYGYFGGETTELPDEIAAKFIEDGVAIMVQETEGDSNTLPEGLPMRDLLFKTGYESVAEIISAKDTLIDVEGVGKASVKKIIEFCDSYGN